MARKKKYASNAERQAAYRARRDADQDRRQNHRQKEQQRYKEMKAAGKITLAEDMTPRDRRNKQKKWRTASRKYREKMRDENNMMLNTPPHSPDERASESNRRTGRRKVKKNRAKCYRDLKKLQNELVKEKQRRYRAEKRYQRLKNKGKKDRLELTPRSKTRNLMRHWKTVIDFECLIKETKCGQVHTCK